ncbi:patatin-like phospholipase [mine drainage metagenome]|uniref:Patatin-like phospholipase n=1 Tax=mine drainage metagenome TaxID=410659 RepID=A0A1J5S073_9ZZZZ
MIFHFSIMKALVISGGGSKGAFAGGIAEYLVKDCGKNYDILVGCSTGSLLLTHLAIGKIDKIKEIFTSVTQKDIFSISPFKIRKTNKGFETSINHFNTLKTFLKGCPTFGESENLRRLIKNNISKEDFAAIKESGRNVIFTVSNLTEQTVEYISSNDCSHEEFCNWAWASTNLVPFMSVFEKNGNQYADGGFGNHIPIYCALENNACEVDVIILENEHPIRKQALGRNAFAILLNTFRFMSTQISIKDIMIGKLMGLNRKVDIRIYYTPRQLTENSLIFDTDQMKQWWQEGYDYAKNIKPICYCHQPVE